MNPAKRISILAFLSGTRVKSVSAESPSGEFYQCMISWVTSNIHELITKIKALVPEVEHFI